MFRTRNHLRPLFFMLAVSAAPCAFAQQAQEIQFNLASGGTLPLPTHMHGSTVVGDRLYILGGENSKGWSNEVYSGRINPDGQVTDWRKEMDMPERRCYLVNSVEAINDRIYVVGGVKADTPDQAENTIRRTSDVLWAQVGNNGAITKWNRSAQFPGGGLSLLAACSDDKYLYITGGSSGDKMSSVITAAQIAADGSLMEWRTVGTMPQTLRFHGAAIQNGRMYLWGGQATRSAGDAMRTVFSAPVQNGTIGAWRNEAEMPTAVYSSSSCGFNDYLIQVGGRYVNGYPTNSMWFSRLNSDGSVMPWTSLKTNLSTRVYHALGLDKTRGIVFISGGKDKQTPEAGSGTILDKLAIFKLTQSSDKTVRGVATSAGAATDLNAAISAASQSGKPVLAFFYAPDVPDCRRALENVINTPQFQALAQRYTIAHIDVSGQSGSEASKRLSVFRVPALAELDASGQLKRKITGLRTFAEVQEMLSGR